MPRMLSIAVTIVFAWTAMACAADGKRNVLFLIADEDVVKDLREQVRSYAGGVW
jgi:hypothetical protein